MKFCCIFNIAPAYREAIFKLMDRTSKFDFYVGEESTDGIALMDARELTGFKAYLHNSYKRGKLIWQSGWYKALRGRYDGYILTGNPGIRSNWLIVIAARLTGRRVYLWSHGLSGKESAMTLRKNLIYFRLASGRMLLYGENSKRILVEHGFDPRKIAVIYNSLDYDNQLRIRDRVGDRGFIRNYFGNDLPYVCYVGRLTHNKRMDQLLEAVVGLDCNVIIIGTGPDQERLETQCERLGLLDRVWFYGESYDQHLIGTVLYHATATVSPGSVGLTAVHSLMFGTPVVTHDNRSIQMPEEESVEEGISGLHFRENDIEDLRHKIATYLGIGVAAREEIREQCYRIVETKYNPRVQLEAMLSQLESGL